jgi:hypothetical protein
MATTDHGKNFWREDSEIDDVRVDTSGFSIDRRTENDYMVNFTEPWSAARTDTGPKAKVDKYTKVIGAIVAGDVAAASGAGDEIIAMHGGQVYTGTGLRDLESEDQVVQTIVEKILSMALTKKVVLAFDPRLGGMHSAKIRAVFEVIEELKKDPKFEKFLRTRNVEVLTKLNDVTKFAGADNAEVFVFAGDSLGIPAAANVHTTIIDEKGFPSNAYYPLAEIVAITLANFLDSSTLDRAKAIANKLNIESITEADGHLVFTLLPSAKEHEFQELVRRYARLKELLRNA